MKPETAASEISVAEVRRHLKAHIREYDACKPQTQRLYLYHILSFIEWIQRSHPNRPGRIILSEGRLMTWLTYQSLAGSVSNAVMTILTTNHFLQYLCKHAVVKVNPMAVIRGRFGKQGWKGIICALRERDSAQALQQLRTEPTYTGNFGRLARSYIQMHRATGKKYGFPEMVLIEFNRFLRKDSKHSISLVTSEHVRRWVAQRPNTKRGPRRRLQILQRFFAYARSSGAITTNPVTPQLLDEVGIPSRSYTPFIYTQAQVAMLVAAAGRLPRMNTFALRPEAMATILSLLYTLGLRISEAVGLRIGDIDFEQQTILVRQTKFYKERYVPFGPKLGSCLQRYLAKRRTVTPDERKEDLVFLRWANRPVTTSLIQRHFRQLVKDAGIAHDVTQSRPRLHDFRHAFAVHRLLRWYREGVDVQSRLVLLSTFMGHVSIYSTQVYLTITGSLLQEGSNRFHAAFGSVSETRRN